MRRLAAAASVVWVLTGCGVKGPPRPPLEQMTAPQPPQLVDAGVP